eukprot:606514-Rhodomonas_salina.1
MPWPPSPPSSTRASGDTATPSTRGATSRSGPAAPTFAAGFGVAGARVLVGGMTLVSMHQAVARAWCVTKPGGHMLLGVPTLVRSAGSFCARSVMLGPKTAAGGIRTTTRTCWYIAGQPLACHCACSSRARLILPVASLLRPVGLVRAGLELAPHVRSMVVLPSHRQLAPRAPARPPSDARAITAVLASSTLP